MGEALASKIPSEVKTLVTGGIYSMFHVRRAPKPEIQFVLITDKIVEGAPQMFWLNENGNPIDVVMKSLTDVTLGERVNFKPA